jgi:hypothetical protein
MVMIVVVTRLPNGVQGFIPVRRWWEGEQCVMCGRIVDARECGANWKELTIAILVL